MTDEELATFCGFKPRDDQAKVAAYIASLSPSKRAMMETMRQIELSDASDGLIPMPRGVIVCGGSDIECVNGVLIDIDVFTEGWERNVIYPPAPCHPDYCASCQGSGDDKGGDCKTCEGTGYVGRRIDCNKRLLAAADLDE